MKEELTDKPEIQPLTLLRIERSFCEFTHMIGMLKRIKPNRYILEGARGLSDGTLKPQNEKEREIAKHILASTNEIIMELSRISTEISAFHKRK